MPLLLTESLDTAGRETTHSHIETCAACGEEWHSVKETWRLLGDLPQVEVPARVRERFLETVLPRGEVVPFRRRPAARWLAQAAAVVIIAGGGYFAGHRTAPLRLTPQPTGVAAVKPLTQAAYSLAETRVLPAAAMSPNIEGRPDIENVQFVDADPRDGQIGVSFDVTSHVTVTGSPADKSMVRLLSYVLQNDAKTSTSRSQAIDWVRQTYSEPRYANTEITQALASVLRNEPHEGVRIRAIDTLQNLPAKMTTRGDATREALIEALKNDPNPSVRIKAVEALSKMASSGQTLDAEAVDTLRLKAAQGDENLYVRVKAAEALSKIGPQ
jgi:HEAT repeats